MPDSSAQFRVYRVMCLCDILRASNIVHVNEEFNLRISDCAIDNILPASMSGNHPLCQY